MLLLNDVFGLFNFLEVFMCFFLIEEIKCVNIDLVMIVNGIFNFNVLIEVYFFVFFWFVVLRIFLINVFLFLFNFMKILLVILIK